MPDDFFDEQVQKVEQLVQGRDDSPDVRRARVVLLRVRHAQRNSYLVKAPRLRRHLLADLRAATRELEGNHD